VTLTGSHLNGAGLEIRVTDTGIGMDASEIDHAMQPFMQVPQTGRRLTAGTGLGLPFAKTIVELHNGALTVASAKGEGTTVLVTLPAQLPVFFHL